MREFLFKKIVDKSFLKAGATIPKNLQDTLLEKIGVVLSKGQKETIQIIIENTTFEAIITNVNFDPNVTDREVVQIRYAAGSPICQKLNKIFAYSAAALNTTVAPENNAAAQEDPEEYVEILAVSQSVLEFRCFPKTTAQRKKAFFEYLGGEDELSGYQRSYKLVFYKYFFELLNDGQEIPAHILAQHFKQYYLERKQANKITDIDVDPVIKNVETSSVESIYKLILRNPFNAISKKQFIAHEDKNGVPYFTIDPQLKHELTSTDIQEIIRIVDKKLELYCSKIDSIVESSSLRNIFNKILNEYTLAKNEVFAGHSMGAYFRNDIPNEIYNTGIVNAATHLITGSVGQGNWATVPWVCIFDRNITASATKGVYIVYLLSKDGKTLYLTLNQGCTDIRRENSKRDTIKLMREKATQIVSQVDSRGFKSDEYVDLGDNLTELAELYERGIIFYKAYRKGAGAP